MKIIHAIFVYTVIVNVCVNARGGHGGHSGHSSHGTGGHAGHSYGSHGYHHVTASHTHYTYHPPRHVSYTCRSCSSPGAYPVYRHPLPTYVYVYKDSDSRYSQILTGLALYNLGRASEVGHHTSTHYSARPQEKCSLQVIERSHFEETEFPCFMISSFIESSPTNKTRSIDIASSQINVKPYLSAGAPLEVTQDQECVLWHNLTTHKEGNHVPCALLKEYANTVKPAGVPVYIWLPTLIGTIIVIYMCCAWFPKKKKETVKEEAPLNELHVVGYCANYSNY